MIDMHSHFFPPIGRELTAAVDCERAPWLQVDSSGDTGHMMLGDTPFRPCTARCGTRTFV